MGTAPLAITPQPVDLRALVEVVQAGASGQFGAVATFIGLVRGNNLGRKVLFLEYEAYEPLAVRGLERIATEVQESWPGVHLAVHHRVGRIELGDASIVIAAASPHRRDAFAACRYTI